MRREPTRLLRKDKLRGYAKRGQTKGYFRFSLYGKKAPDPLILIGLGCFAVEFSFPRLISGI